jgi:hypothetical protein
MKRLFLSVAISVVILPWIKQPNSVRNLKLDTSSIQAKRVYRESLMMWCAALVYPKNLFDTANG